MSDQTRFANTINSLDSGLSHPNMTECESFGITWGCRVHCPAFEKGNCQDVFVENIESFIKEGDLDEDEMREIINLYKPKMTIKETLHLEKLNRETSS